MPWSDGDADRHIKGLSPGQKAAWAKIANSALKSCLAKGGSQESCEGKAIRIANAAVKNVKPTANKLDLAFVRNQSLAMERKTVRGHEYLVVPVVSLVEGVVNGELALAEEFGRFVGAWNGIPVVMGHPVRAGQYVTAADPEISPLGRVYNSRLDGNRLLGDVYFEPDIEQREDKEVKELLARLNEGRPIEVSTGYWREMESKRGNFNGKVYNAVQRHLRPDHLAILLHENGACSIHDGCGLLRANVDAGCPDLIVCNCGETPHCEGEHEKGQPSALLALLRQIFSKEKGKMDELIDRIVALSPKLTKASLEAFSEDELTVLVDVLEGTSEQAEETESTETETEAESDGGSAEGEGDNEPEWAKALRQQVGALAKEVGTIKNGLAAEENREKGEIVNALVANAANTFTKAELNEMSLAQIQKIAAMLEPADYSGRGGIRAQRGEETELELPMPFVNLNGGSR